MPKLTIALPLAVTLPLLATSLSAAANPPDLSGSWAMNLTLSEDAAAKIAAVAGPDAVAGAGRTLGHTTFFPRAYGREVDRVNVRQFLLDAVAGLARLEIEQTADEVKTIHGDDEVRLFYLKRESSGAGADGVKLTRRTRWQGEQLILESESGKAKLVEVLTLVPARNQLLHALHYEAEALDEPLELKLVYDRAATTAR